MIDLNKVIRALVSIEKHFNHALETRQFELIDQAKSRTDMLIN